MYEKVNPCHPDKVADRIAGAIVDLANAKSNNPKCAVEVLIGHGDCFIIIESSTTFTKDELQRIVSRITGNPDFRIWYNAVPQDAHLANNQAGQVRCGDNGIFKGTPVTAEQAQLTEIAHMLFKQYPTDGKHLINVNDITVCQSYADGEQLYNKYKDLCHRLTVNPLGDWTGGPDVDSGATNRKLGSDMGDGVTGGGLHGKDLSKADVSVNIWCFLRAQETGKPVTAICNIGDIEVETSIGRVPYADMVAEAEQYIHNLGGFEKFAEWGLIR